MVQYALQLMALVHAVPAGLVKSAINAFARTDTMGPIVEKCASVRVRIRTSVIRGPENASASLDGMATLVPGLVRSIPTARAAKVIATAGITRSVPP